MYFISCVSDVKLTNISGPRIITPDSFNDDRKVPAALVLPQGKFFFGFKYIPYDPSKVVKKNVDIAPTGTQAFSGEGTSLKSKKPGGTLNVTGNGKGKEKEGDVTSQASTQPQEKADPWAKLGSGNALKPAASTTTTKTSNPSRTTTTRNEPDIIDATMLDEDDFFEVPDDDDDDDDIIEIDSD